MTAATLTGITHDAGQCDRCGRELGRIFGVRWPDGTEQSLGRRCAAKATGWAAGAVEREAARLRWLADRDARRAAHRTELVAAGHGDRLAWLEAHSGIVPGYGVANAPACVLASVLDGCDRLLYEEVTV
jgi:hypothetical protein